MLKTNLFFAFLISSIFISNNALSNNDGYTDEEIERGQQIVLALGVGLVIYAMTLEGDEKTFKEAINTSDLKLINKKHFGLTLLPSKTVNPYQNNFNSLRPLNVANFPNSSFDLVSFDIKLSLN